MSEQDRVPDVRKSVTVDVPVERAFAIFAERPIEWWPEKHVFVEDRRSLTIEPHPGGAYYEVGADGTRIDWGTVAEWSPPHRIVLTWRVGEHWRPLPDDEGASFIEVDFTPAGPGRTTVALTHSGLDRHGGFARSVHAALDGPSPGETLAQYRAVVERQLAADRAAGTGPASAPGAVREVAARAPQVILLNRFSVTGPVEEFERVFEETAAYFAAQPGFIEHTLVRQFGAPATYVNIARWTDQASLRAAVDRPEFQPHSDLLRTVSTSDPQLFSVRLVTAASAN